MRTTAFTALLLLAGVASVVRAEGILKTQASCSCQPGGSEPHGTWIQRFPQHSPPGRWHRLMVYDSARRVAVVFGGAFSCGDRRGTNDTWEFDGLDWREIATPHSPPPRYYGGLAYDSDRRVVVLFGGYETNSGGPAYNDTWEYDGTDWRQVVPALSPAPCVRFSMAYDPHRHRVVLRGQRDEPGDGSCGIGQSTWEYDGSTWSRVYTTSQPPDGGHSNWHTYFAWSSAQGQLLY